jgi:galactokinase/mevalonate kinase-like predicted kinase
MGDQETAALLREMSQKMDLANEKLDRLETTAAKSGAVAGAISGGVAGGLVATAIVVIRAKLGL